MAFTFNNVTKPTYLKVNKITHSILPSLSTKLVNAPKRAGAWDFGIDVGVREIEMDVTLIANDEADLRVKVREVAEWLFQEDLSPLVFDDETDKTYYARISGDTDLDGLLNFGQTTLVFVCPDPYAEGAVSTQTIEKGYPESPTFNRDSQAYDSIGAYYANDKPRYENGQLTGTKGIIVEEGTTNLLTSPTAPTTQEVAVTAGNDYTLSLYGTGATAKIEHKKLESTQADFQQGTLQDIIATSTGELYLASKTAPTFTRTGLAWGTDGAQAEDGQPRYAPSKFVKGIMVEESTSNLIANGSFTTDTNADGLADNWTKWESVAGANTVAQDTTQAFVGTISQKVTVSAGNNGGIYQDVTVTAGQKYSVSGYLKVLSLNTGANVAVKVEWLDASNVVLAGTVTVATVSAVDTEFTRRLAENLTAPTGAVKARVRFDITAGGSFVVDAVQLENKTYCTSYAFSTRNKEDFTFPTSGNLRGSEGTIELVFRRTGTPTQWANVFNWGVWSSPVTTDHINIAHGTGNGLNKFVAEIRDKVTAQVRSVTVTLPANTVIGQDYYIALRWKLDGANGYIKLDVYDYTAGTWHSGGLTALTMQAPQFTGYPNAYVGSDGSTYQLNAIIDGIRASLFARTDAEITSIASNTLTDMFAPVDEKTAYQMLFNGSLLVANGGYRISPAFALDNIGTIKGTGLVDWSEGKFTNTDVKQYLSLDNGTTWVQVTNGGSMGLVDGSSAVGKTVMFKTVLTQWTSGSKPYVAYQRLYIAQADPAKVKPAFNAIVLTPTSVAYWQFEAKPYKTSFVDSTRQPETLIIDGAEAIFTNFSQSTSEGTIEIRAYEDGVNRNAFLFDTWDGNDYDGINNDRMLIEKIKNANGVPTYVIYANKTYLGEVPVASVGFHVYAVRWLSNVLEVLIDGVVKATYTLGSSVSTNDIRQITLGSRYQASSGDWQQWNNVIDEVRFSKVKRTNEELLANVNAYMPVDTNTVYKVDFEGTLDIVAEDTNHNVVVVGSAKTYPIITARFKQNTSYVKISIGTRFILINHDFLFGDELVIDLEKALVTVNGMRILNKVDLASQFFPLNKGTNTFTIEPQHLADIDVQFREKWL